MTENILIIQAKRHEASLNIYRDLREKLWGLFQDYPKVKELTGTYTQYSQGGLPYEFTVAVERGGTEALEENNVKLTISYPLEDKNTAAHDKAVLYEQYFYPEVEMELDEILEITDNPYRIEIEKIIDSMGKNGVPGFTSVG